MFRQREQKKILLCFFCNAPSTVTINRHVPLRKWYCSQCEQTNHLDEYGEIADYTPPSDLSPAPPLCPSPTASPRSPALSSPFCDVCISNQTLLIKNLASFLPPEDHPDYDTYAAALPAHKAELEVKYPQVCPDCEERVRSRLQRNNYLAKTSALGGFLKRRKLQQQVAERPWDLVLWLRSSVWFVRGLLWWVTTILFLFWCFVGTCSYFLELMEGFIRPEVVGSVYRSRGFGDDNAFRIHLPPVVEKVFTMMSDPFWATKLRILPRIIASLSPFVVMWDYKWLAAKRIPGSQVEGLREYRELQVIVTALRLLAWGLTRWTINPVLIMWGSAFLGIISLLVKLPPEIALQDIQDDLDFTPQSSPSPTPKPAMTFQRTQPPPPKFPALKPVNDSLDLTSLGISEKPLPPFRDSAETMDWVPSSQPNSFTRPITTYSQEQSVFASGRGTLPPAPGTGFPSATKSTKSDEVNWFKSSVNVPLHSIAASPPREEYSHLREQRLFARQALTLDDEPTLVRAVKAVKRNLERDKNLYQAYISVAVSTIATLFIAICAQFTRFEGGLSGAYIIWGIGRIASDYRIPTLFASVAAIVFGVIMGLPISGLVIPYHRLLLRLYDPRIQNVLQVAGVVLVVGILARDTAMLVTIKLERRRKAEEEERKRQEKMKGLFYTKPTGKRAGAPTGRSVSLWNGDGGVRERGRDGGHLKSKSMFSTARH